MDFKNVQSASRKDRKDIPEEMNIDFENEDDESLKRLGRQAED